jgi:transcriptional regulator with XRE-family HTH domain
MNDVRITIDGATVEALQRLMGQINGYQSKPGTMVPEVVEKLGTPSSVVRLEVAKRIHGIRSRSGRTVEDVAEEARIPVGVLERLEAGTHYPRNTDVLYRLAEALGVQAFDLDPRFDPGGPLSSIPAPGITRSEYLDYTRDTYSPERLADDGKDSDGIG